MKKIKFINVFLSLILIVTSASFGAQILSNENNSNLNFTYSAVNRASNIRENSSYDDIINSYLAGEDVGAIVLDDGDIKIPLDNGNYIIIPTENNLDNMIDKKDDNFLHEHASRSSDVTYHGEISKPGYPISNTVCAPATGSLQHTFLLSSSFGYQITASAGVSIETFEASLGFTLNRIFTISESYQYTIPKNCCGTVYGSEVYDKYTYRHTTWYGYTKTGTLLAPKRYLIYVIVIG